MRRSHYVLASVVAIVLITLVFFDNKKTIASNNTMASQQKKSSPEQHEDKVRTISASPRRKLTITSEEILHMRESLPAIEKVKEEVRANPHMTPPSLQNFAKSMSPLMEKALKDKREAGILFNALQDCALDESSAHAARVLCVTNSERLAQNHQQLKSKVEKIRANLDPKVKKILDRQDALKKI